MSLKLKIEQDLKEALLSGDKLKSETLRVVKSVLLNEEIAKSKRDVGLSDEEVIVCLKKEAKKRREAAELYEKAQALDRANKELTEEQIISTYLPAMMSEEDLKVIIERIILGLDAPLSIKSLGVVIGKAKQEAGNSADGEMLARLVKEKLN